jgi:hypothetical protein
MGTDDPLALLAHRGPAVVSRVAADNAAAFLGAAAGRDEGA